MFQNSVILLFQYNIKYIILSSNYYTLLYISINYYIN